MNNRTRTLVLFITLIQPCVVVAQNSLEPHKGLREFIGKLSRRTSYSVRGKEKLFVRFFRGVIQAEEMIEKILRVYKMEDPLAGQPEIKQTFIQVSEQSFDFTSMTCDELQSIRKQLTHLQELVDAYHEQMQESVDDEQFNFIQLMLEFCSTMLNDVLHEQFLPYLEGNVQISFVEATESIHKPLMWFSLGALAWLGITVYHKHRSGENLAGKDVVDTIAFGTIVASLHYIIGSLTQRDLEE